MTVRQSVRRLGESLFAAPAFVRSRLAGRAGQTLILAYHNIVPEGEPLAGEHSLHLDQGGFADHLDTLTSLLPVVRLRDVLDGTWDRGEAAAVITFDDAYSGALTAGVEELARRNLPATVFVAPAFLGGRSFWWDAFADRRTGALDDPLRERALTEWRGEDLRIRSEFEVAGREAAELPDHARAASEGALQAAVRSAGIDLGPHTWSHANLDALSEDEAEGEIRRSMDWLAERFAYASVPALALPYGLGDAYAAIARRAGCTAVLRIRGGWARPDRDLPVLPRFNVPRGLTPAGLRFRLAGFRL